MPLIKGVIVPGVIASMTQLIHNRLVTEERSDAVGFVSNTARESRQDIPIVSGSSVASVLSSLRFITGRSYQCFNIVITSYDSNKLELALSSIVANAACSCRSRQRSFSVPETDLQTGEQGEKPSLPLKGRRTHYTPLALHF